jgi:hypothetical protein
MIPPDQEIYEVEKRIAQRRHRVEAFAQQTGRSALRALTSPWALAGAAVIGFLAAGGVRRRREEHKHERRKMSASDKKAAKASVISSLGMTALTWFIKSQFGSPVAMAQYFLAKFKKEPDPRMPASPRNDRIPATTRR